MTDEELLQQLSDGLNDYKMDVDRILRLVKSGTRSLTNNEYAEFKTLLTYTRNGI